jgi:hypothetical protein
VPWRVRRALGDHAAHAGEPPHDVDDRDSPPRGAKVYACRFAMGALYGFREEGLIDGVQAFNPLDVLDSALTAWRAGAFQLNTWAV